MVLRSKACLFQAPFEAFNQTSTWETLFEAKKLIYILGSHVVVPFEFSLLKFELPSEYMNFIYMRLTNRNYVGFLFRSQPGRLSCFPDPVFSFFHPTGTIGSDTVWVSAKFLPTFESSLIS